MSNVESPNHYTAGYIEVIYAIHDVLGREGFKAFCMGNYIKYNARANHKGLKAEDLAKADQYLEWATNGLPHPVNGRVPRALPEDPYKRIAEAMAMGGAAKVGNAVHEAVERAVKSSPELAAGYGEAPAGYEHAVVQNDTPNAETVANIIEPVLVGLLGKPVMDGIRLHVTKNQRTDHVWFTARVYDREDNDEISRAEIMAESMIDGPDEAVCSFVGECFAIDIQRYLS